MTEMPSRADLKDKISIDLFECPEFKIEGVLFPGNRMHLHTNWQGKKLTPSLYKKALLGIAMIRKGCREAGIPAIYALVPESLVKWESMLGFVPIEVWTNNFNPDENLVLCKQEA